MVILHNSPCLHLFYETLSIIRNTNTTMKMFFSLALLGMASLPALSQTFTEWQDPEVNAV